MSPDLISHTDPPPSERRGVAVRSLVESDLATAEAIFRLAFGTFLRAAQPETFWADRDYVRARWRADPKSTFGAAIDGQLVGTNFAVSWGSVGFFGPLTIHPKSWDQGIGQRLVEAVVKRLDEMGVRHAGLFTFAESGKHVSLYQKFGFWPRFLTAVMAKSVTGGVTVPEALRYSGTPESERTSSLADCRELTDALYDGLDLSGEIQSVHDQGRGDTILLREGSRLAGFAVCHHGPRSEAGAGACLIKFAAVRPGPAAEGFFDRLLVGCEALAARAGMSTLLAGVNMECHQAYRHLIGRGFRAALQGVNMHRPNEPGYYHDEAYILDDWR